MTPTYQAIDLRAVKSVLRNWVADGSGLHAVWANQNAPQPDWPYATLRLTQQAEGLGQDVTIIREEGGTVFADVAGPRTLTFSIQAHVGPPDDNSPDCDAHAYLASAYSALKLPSIADEFRANQIGIGIRGPIVDIETLVDADWISRAAMTLDVNVVSCVSEEISCIEAAEITGTVNRADDTEITVGPFLVEVNP